MTRALTLAALVALFMVRLNDLTILFLLWVGVLTMAGAALIHKITHKRP